MEAVGEGLRRGEVEWQFGGEMDNGWTVVEEWSSEVERREKEENRGVD